MCDKPKLKPKFPKRTQFTIYRRTSLASADAPIKQVAANAQDDAHDVRYPVVDVGAAVEAGLDEFDDTPYALAPMKTGIKPKRRVRASGKASAAKAMKCTNLSLPSGAEGGVSKGQSIAMVRVSFTIMVRRMSRFLRIRWGLSGKQSKGKRAPPMFAFVVK